MLKEIFRHIHPLKLIAWALLFFAASVFADIDEARLDAVISDLQSRVDDNRLSGAVVMVAQDGEVLLNRALGYQSVEEQTPMQTDSIFRIFSMTKPITGAALMTLYDEGRFALDDPLEKHLPELANMAVFVDQDDEGNWITEPADHPMTIRELMSHTGGLVYTPPLSRGPIAEAYYEAGIMNLREYSLSESIPALANIPLGYQPGSQWVYSISVDVQGYLIERLSGMRFDQFLRQRLFEPLGMNDTGFYVSSENAERLAGQYAPGDDGELRRSDDGAFLSPPRFQSGGGGLTSTADDYMAFAQMLLNEGEHEGRRILSAETVELMRSNQLPEAVENIGALYPGNVFGLDFAIVERPEIFQGLSKGSFWWWGIAGSWFWIDPVEDIVFIGMIQNDDILYSLQVHAAARAALYQ